MLTEIGSMENVPDFVKSVKEGSGGRLPHPLDRGDDRWGRGCGGPRAAGRSGGLRRRGAGAPHSPGRLAPSAPGRVPGGPPLPAGGGGSAPGRCGPLGARAGPLGGRMTRQAGWRRALVAPALLLLGAVLAFYGRALHIGFTSEDFVLLRLLREDPPWRDLFAKLTSPLLGLQIFKFYRPVSTLLFGLEDALFGVEPFGYHLVQTLVHAGNALLVYGIVRRIAGRAGEGSLPVVPLRRLAHRNPLALAGDPGADRTDPRDAGAFGPRHGAAGRNPVAFAGGAGADSTGVYAGDAGAFGPRHGAAARSPVAFAGGAGADSTGVEQRPADRGADGPEVVSRVAEGVELLAL